MHRLHSILIELTPDWLLRRASPLPPEGLPSSADAPTPAADPHVLARRADRQWARCVDEGLYGTMPSVRRH
jgi:hypothetical protein